MNNNDKFNIIDYIFILLDTKTKPHYTHGTIYNQKIETVYGVFSPKRAESPQVPTIGIKKSGARQTSANLFYQNNTLTIINEYCSGNFSLTSPPTWLQDADTILTRAVDTNAWQIQR